jgi:hypothetical protein
VKTALMVVTPTGTAVKLAKETMIITCSGIPTTSTDVMVTAEPGDHSEDGSRTEEKGMSRT